MWTDNYPEAFAKRAERLRVVSPRGSLIPRATAAAAAATAATGIVPRTAAAILGAATVPIQGTWTEQSSFSVAKMMNYLRLHQKGQFLW